jgi:HAD superfamily hydrolase (TIGR01509 family)
MTKAFIFDFDGVIADTETVRMNDLKELLKTKNLADFDFNKAIGTKTAFFLEQTFPELKKEEIVEIVKKVRNLRFVHAEEYKLIAGLQELLTFLKKQDYTIAITTGSEKKLVEKILEINKLSNYFDILVTGEDFTKSKPDTECFEITLKKLNLEPKEVVVIEDSVAGIQAAKSLGCKVFGLKTYFDENQLSQADQVFQDHTEILDFLKK